MTKYWQNIFTNWIESEYMFDLLNGPYDDIFVFDRYAITMKNSNLINVVFFEKWIGGLVSPSDERALYDTLEWTQDTFDVV